MLPPQNIQNVSDTFLWTKFKEGDALAFRRIYDKHNDIMLKYGLTIVNDRELVKDCIQDLFIEIWKQRLNLAYVQSVKYYLFTSLRRLIINKNKKIVKSGSALKLFSFLNKDNFEKSASDCLIEVENGVKNAIMISEAIKKLPSRQKEAIFLRYYEGLQYDEIEKIMQLNYQVVRNTIYKAIKSLRVEMEQNRTLFQNDSLKLY